MHYNFTLELLNRKGRFICEFEARVEIQTDEAAWFFGDVEIVTWDNGNGEWTTLDEHDPAEAEIAKQANVHIKANSTKLEIDSRIGWNLLEAGIIPVPEYEHLTKHEYGIGARA